MTTLPRMPEPAPVTGQLAAAALPPQRRPTVPAVPRALSDDPEWYRTAVFYEVLVRAFSDSTASGSGDLRGLVDRLDYLQWLGIDCIWIPLFFLSPERDRGYDVQFMKKAARRFDIEISDD